MTRVLLIILNLFFLLSCKKDTEMKYIVYSDNAKMFKILTPEGYVKSHSRDAGYEQIQYVDTSYNSLLKLTLVPFTGYHQSVFKEVQTFKNEFQKNIKFGEIKIKKPIDFPYLNFKTDSIFIFSEVVQRQKIVKHCFLIKSKECSSFIFLIFDFALTSNEKEVNQIIRKILLSYKCNWGAPWNWYPKKTNPKSVNHSKTS
jgi:hypothetical protein